MDLVCPEGHVAGQLIQDIEHQSIGIEVPDRGARGMAAGRRQDVYVPDLPRLRSPGVWIDRRDPGEGHLAD
jgi:hypothetical protein